MKSHKTHLCLFVALTMLMVAFTGCSGEKKAEAFSYSGDIDKNGFWKKVTALDYVEMYDYDGFEIPSDVHKISDEDVQSSIDSILEENSTSEEITDRTVADGDTVNIDYVGSTDGEEFEGGSTGGTGTEITIGETQYIDGFLEQLIGHNPGETFDINVTFPEDYQQETLQGKAAVFVTTINHIVNKVAPELTDEFVSEKLSATQGWKTVAELKDGVYADLQKKAIQSYVQDYLVNDVKVKSIPEKITEYQKNAMIKYYEDSAANYDMELEEFLKSYAGVESLDELIETNATSNEESAKFSLVIQAIAEDAKISVSEDDVVKYFKDEVGTDDITQYEEDFGMPYLKQAVLANNVMAYLVKQAKLK